MEKRDCSWVLRSLWSSKSTQRVKIRLFDSILSDEKSELGLSWLFTDQSGSIRKHSAGFLTFERLFQAFTRKTAVSDQFTAVLITNNHYEVLSQAKTVAILTQRSLPECSVLQQFRCPDKDIHIRYQLTYQYSEGRDIYRAERVRKEPGNPEITSLRASNLCKEMERMGKEVRTTLERQTYAKVTELVLLFVLDRERLLWLSGSQACIMVRKRVGRSIRSLHFKPALSPCSSQCQGDFCAFLLGSPMAVSQDKLTSESLLELLHNSPQRDGEMLKFAIAADFLRQAKEEMKAKRAEYRIPGKYVRLGRALLRESGVEKGKAGEMVLDSTQLERKREMLREEMAKVEKAGLTQPSAFYEDLKVCRRCYSIYLHLRRALHSLPSSSPPLSHFPSRSGSVSRLSEAYMQTSLGCINKNSLEDLLVDLRYAREEELQGRQDKGDLMRMYKAMTQAEKRKKAEEKGREVEGKAVLFSVRKEEKSSVERDLALRYFPSVAGLNSPSRLNFLPTAPSTRL